MFRRIAPILPTSRANGDTKYLFPADVFSRLLSPYRGRPVHYLEVGCYEGRSALWMMDNILTHRAARAVCLDQFDGPYYSTFLRNLKHSGHQKKVRVIKAPSSRGLRKLPMESFDVIYLDASHAAYDILTDACLSWLLLKNGGLLIFDDYKLCRCGSPDIRTDAPIDAFLAAFGRQLNLLHRGEQVIVKKIPLNDRAKKLLPRVGNLSFPRQTTPS